MENFEHQNLIGIKSEFEAEGLTQLEIADYFVTNPWANLRVVKLGGCEAKTDFRAAVRLGANVLVAPMIESVFAAEKFSGMYADHRTVHRWINLETVNGRKFAREICSFASSSGITGVVIGRGDLAESMGLTRESADSTEVQEEVMHIASTAKEYGLHVGVGGVIGLDSEDNLRRLASQGLIDHFETRKVLISASSPDFSETISRALRVEMNWLTSSISNLESLAKDLRSRAERLEKNIKP